MKTVGQAPLERSAMWVSTVVVRYTSGCKDTVKSPLASKHHDTLCGCIDAHRE